MATNPQDIADAYQHVARVNHYLVHVAKPDGASLTWEELGAAEQILITLDNAANNANPVLNLALDLIEADTKAALAAA